MKGNFILIWNYWHAQMLLVLIGLCLFHLPMGYVLTGAGLSFCLYFALAYFNLPLAKSFANSANWVTFFRLLILLFAVSFYPALQTAVFVGLIISVMILDGLDGMLARKFKKETKFGEYFDMEVDALLASLLSVLVYKHFDIGFWILLAGAMRYIFVTIKFLLGLDNVALTIPMPGSRLIAVVFFSTLLAAFVFPIDIARWLLIPGCSLIFFSFGREFILIIKQKKHRNQGNSGAN